MTNRLITEAIIPINIKNIHNTLWEIDPREVRASNYAPDSVQDTNAHELLHLQTFLTMHDDWVKEANPSSLKNLKEPHRIKLDFILEIMV
jgi:hypothetical protein